MKCVLLALAVTLGLTVLSACDDQDYVINQEFSVNLFQPGPKWPKVKKLKPLEKEVYEKYGKPDHFRIWWTPSGQPKQRLDLEKQFSQKSIKQVPKYSWVYLQQGKEIVFGATNYQEVSLTDQVRILTEYGDPEDVKELSGGITQWMFYGAGKLYKFVNGRIVEQKELPAMGRFLKY